MQFKLLTLAVLLCAVFASSKIRFQDTKAVLAEIDQDRFGATILSAVQMNLSAESPMEEITILIEEILDQVESDQAAADEKNRTDTAVCDEMITSLTNQIAETKATIDSTEKAITENEAILSMAKIDLAQADQDYEETVESITVGTAERAEQHDRWVEEDYNQQIQIATLEEGVKLINHMIHGVAFSQIKSRYDKVLEKLSDSSSKHSTMFKPLVTSLTQLATKLNYENVMKILDLLNNIRSVVVESRENERIAEEKAQADWEKLLAHLTAEKQRLSDKRARLRSLIDATTTLLAQLRTSLENNKVQLENLEGALAAQTAWCNEQADTYATETEERTREADILNKLLDHIREKFAAVGEYVSERGVQF